MLNTNTMVQWGWNSPFISRVTMKFGKDLWTVKKNMIAILLKFIVEMEEYKLNREKRFIKKCKEWKKFYLF